MAAAGEGRVPVRTAARAPFHALRSAMVALTVLSLAAGAHTLAGGQLPSPGILLALLALTGLASTTATRLKLNLPAMAGLLGAGQLVLHNAFTAFSGPAFPEHGRRRREPATRAPPRAGFRCRPAARRSSRRPGWIHGFHRFPC